MAHAETSVREVLEKINRRDTDDALEHYRSDYDFYLAFALDLKFSKEDMIQFFEWDRIMEVSFELQGIGSIEISSDETWVFVDMIERSTFYQLLGNDYRRTNMVFHVDSEGRFRRSLVLSTVDFGRAVDDGVRELVTWVARHEPGVLSTLPIPPIGSPQTPRPRPFDASTATEWLRLARSWKSDVPAS